MIYWSIIADFTRPHGTISSLYVDYCWQTSTLVFLDTSWTWSNGVYTYCCAVVDGANEVLLFMLDQQRSLYDHNTKLQAPKTRILHTFKRLQLAKSYASNP